MHTAHLLATLVTLYLGILYADGRAFSPWSRDGSFNPGNASKYKGDDLAPVYYAVGPEPTINTTVAWTASTIISLNASSTVATLDYGSEAAGIPFIYVQSLSGPAQLELRYGEQFPALQNPNGDGPWTFINGLTNTFRTETLNITTTGRVESFFVQGGQRWQSVRLLTEAPISLSAGLRLTSDHLAPAQLSGRFSASNPLYEEIFDLGGRTVQAACIDRGAAPSVWEVTSDGVRVRGQQTSQSIVGINFSNYTISFMTKVIQSGTAFRVASGVFPYGAYFVLTTQSTPYLDTNRTVLPANSLIWNYGWSMVNQSTLAVPAVHVLPLKTPIVPDTWYNIALEITSTGYNISLDGRSLAFISSEEILALLNPLWGSPTWYSGTWGFGPFQGQDAFFKDVKVIAKNGTVLYNNSMMSSDVLAEYSVLPNPNPVCMDGAKRDRLVWVGDFAHTCRVVLHSTNRLDYLRGSISQALAWASDHGPTAGFVGMDSPLGTTALSKAAYSDHLYSLFDYQDLFILALGDYYWATGDLAFIKAHWSQIGAAVDGRLTLNNPTTSLSETPDIQGIYFLGPANGSAASAVNVLALQRAASLASAVGDVASVHKWTAVAQSISTAINSLLWNPESGVYSLSTAYPDDFSLAAIAFTIRAGIANATQAAAMIQKVPQLRLGIGFKDSSMVNSTATTQLSPNTQGFLLEALFLAHRDFGTPLDSARVLLDTFWAAMVTQNQYYSGASWEYTYPDGSPGIDLFTSLSDPWGAAPTYLLSEYVLGISATKPGYTSWSMQPLVEGLGLTHASGTVPTPSGPIEANWHIVGNNATICVSAPKVSRGQIVFGGQKFAVSGGQQHCVNVAL
ncbi:hypothetical protein PV08_07087 [Exophiala spinifera]|uniref:Alpha-L-rhamnosidase C-terminal domain-containing protein n=1 Tax=Exophiala spinifera TaxID=91928 RepID=A0A0D2B6I5_9EURO|nr:uncharacterized protein PV08_07087 [Exophiala spinifera]KIW14305.1 hypothetical protein PV08_07087 [Exophiala spinifera]